MPTWLDKVLNSQFVMIGLAGLAFLIALWLVIVIVRMMTGGRLRFNSGRTRQARLGIVDAFDLDRQRQLIIVRRDNTEHLIMIGGPNDLVIESEIVRVEARENRRATDKPEGFADNRIPAPIMVPDGGPAAAEEPLLPMPLPSSSATEKPRRDPPTLVAPQPALDPLPPRTPTFPLPPRRPAPQPERRPPPPPESASRTEEPTPAAPPPPVAPEPPLAALAPSAEPFPPPYVPPQARVEAAEPAPVEIFPTPPPVPPQPLPPIVPTQGADMPRPPVRPPPPSFLKPLPPRPPIRPLRRATPQAPGTTPPGALTASVPVAPEVAAPPAEAPAPSPPPAPPPLPVAEVPAPMPEAPPPAPAPETRKPDALESLEEEMAKLLGRG